MTPFQPSLRIATEDCYTYESLFGGRPRWLVIRQEDKVEERHLYLVLVLSIVFLVLGGCGSENGGGPNPVTGAILSEDASGEESPHCCALEREAD